MGREMGNLPSQENFFSTKDTVKDEAYDKC